MNKLSLCCQAEKRYSTSGCQLCWSCSKCNNFGGCDNYVNTMQLNDDFFIFNVSMESKTMTTIKDIVSEIDEKEVTKTPELSHGDSDDTTPPIPPNDDSDDDDEDEDEFDKDQRFELELIKEHNKAQYRKDRIKIDAFHAITERIETLHELIGQSFTTRFLYNPKLNILTDEDLKLDLSVRQAKERYQVTLYDQMSKLLRTELVLEENTDG